MLSIFSFIGSLVHSFFYIFWLYTISPLLLNKLTQYVNYEIHDRQRPRERGRPQHWLWDGSGSSTRRSPHARPHWAPTKEMYHRRHPHPHTRPWVRGHPAPSSPVPRYTDWKELTYKSLIFDICFVLLRTGSASLFFAELFNSIVYSARWVSMGLNLWCVSMVCFYRSDQLTQELTQLV